MGGGGGGGGLLLIRWVWRSNTSQSQSGLILFVHSADRTSLTHASFYTWGRGAEQGRRGCPENVYIAARGKLEGLNNVVVELQVLRDCYSQGR